MWDLIPSSYPFAKNAKDGAPGITFTKGHPLVTISIRPFSSCRRPFQMIPFDLPKEVRADAIASLKRYFQENMPEPIGDLPAGLLLNFFIEEIGPAVYNHAIADAQARMQQRVSDLNGELYADEFQYWPRVEDKRKKRR
ncbi:MAG: DUF2164 domain-containing protein [Acidobacteriaceae bacterium]